MRKIILFALMATALTVGAQTTDGDGQKIGHADWELIFGQLPEYKQIENELMTYEQQLKTQLAAKAHEIEIKYKAFQELPANTPDPVRRDKAAELNYLQETMQRFERDAQESMQKKQSDLVSPILEKIEKAIELVAKENGYAYIVNPKQVQSGPFILYADDKYNIAPLVLKKLGVDPEKKPVAQQPLPRRY